MLNYSVIIKPDERTGTDQPCYSAYCPTLDIYSEGDTVEQALENMRGAIKVTLEVIAEDHRSIPVESQSAFLTRTSVTAPATMQIAAV